MTYEAAAAAVATTVLAAPPSLGTGRLVCVDGPSGSGKSTLAAALAGVFRDRRRLSMRVLHMEDLYAGWAGLEAGMTTLATSVVEPLLHGEPGRYRRFDWHASDFAEEQVVVPPCDVLVVEGVGAWSSAIRAAVTCLVWADAPSDVRLERSVARDGESMRGHLLSWRAQEEAMFVRERTRANADLVVDGQTGSVST